MYIDLLKRELFGELEDLANNYREGKKVDFTRIKKEFEKILKGAEDCKNVIDNRRNITDKEFYDMLEEIAFIEWDEEDYYKIIGKANNIEYVGDDTILTTMEQFVSTNEELEDVGYWDDETGISLKILYTKDFKIDDEHYYTIEEMERLIAEKKIFVIWEEQRTFYCDEDFEPEKPKSFGYDYYESDEMERDFFTENGKYFLYTLKYIREKINTKSLKKLYNGHLQHLNAVNEELTNESWRIEKEYQSVVRECKKEFEKSGYMKRIRKLNNKCK